MMDKSDLFFFEARDPQELGRVSTPLEILFDLVIVVAVAAATFGLHDAIVENQMGRGVVTFLMVFFAMWWVWVNFTWFASAYENDGLIYRLIALWTMVGALVFGSGVSRIFEALDLSLAIIGYGIMRVAMVVLWLIAARSDPAHRSTALCYAVGIVLMQLYWVAVLFIPASLSPSTIIVLCAVGAILEMLVPLIAERFGAIPRHICHISQQHGLLLTIVLGEILLVSAAAFMKADGSAGHVLHLVVLEVSALAVTFSMWWLYFSQEGLLGPARFCRGLWWSYAHAFIYAAVAATGAGFGVVIDGVVRKWAIGAAGADKDYFPLLIGNFAVVIPAALFMAALWLVRDRVVLSGRSRYILLAFAVAALIAAALGKLALPVLAIVMVTAVIMRGKVQRDHA